MAGVIDRTRHETTLRALLDDFPVVAIVGARQVGKTTLARLLVEDAGCPVTVFDP